MNKDKSKSLLRWFVLIVIGLHVLYNELYDVLFPGKSIASVSDKYKSLSTPAGYTFSIWGLIYIALIVYGIYQLMPSQRDKEVYNKAAFPLMISLLLGIWWNISFHLELIGLSEIAIVLMLVSAYMAYRVVESAVFLKEAGKWLLVPFSLYFGWLTAANIASFNTWLVYIGSGGSVFGDINVARMLIFLATIVGIIVSVKYWDYVYPLVISWALVGIYIAKKDDNSPIGFAAFICAVVLIIWSVIVISIKKNPRVEAQVR